MEEDDRLYTANNTGIRFDMAEKFGVVGEPIDRIDGNTCIILSDDPARLEGDRLTYTIADQGYSRLFMGNITIGYLTTSEDLKEQHMARKLESDAFWRENPADLAHMVANTAPRSYDIEHIKSNPNAHLLIGTIPRGTIQETTTSKHICDMLDIPYTTRILGLRVDPDYNGETIGYEIFSGSTEPMHHDEDPDRPRGIFESFTRYTSRQNRPGFAHELNLAVCERRKDLAALAAIASKFEIIPVPIDIVRF